MAYDFDRMRAAMLAADLTTVQLVWREAPDRFRARDPFAVGGVVEDPATGAAAAALGAYLRWHGDLVPPAAFTIVQGVEMGRPSRIEVDCPRRPRWHPGERHRRRPARGAGLNGWPSGTLPAVTFETPGSMPAIDPSATEPSPSLPPPSKAPRSNRPRDRYVPAVLDAVIPGLGHLVVGRRRRAALFLIPVAVAAVAAIIVGLTTSGPRLVAELLAEEVIWSLIIAQGLFLVWRLLAVVSSLWNPALVRPSARDALPIAFLLILVVAPQAFAGYATEVARESIDEIFVEPAPVAAIPSGTPAPDPSFLETAPPTPSASAGPSASPAPTPAVPRITGLDHRRRRRDRAEHVPDRHDDRRVARPGHPDRVDGVDPARHGRRSACRTAAATRARSTRWCPTRGIIPPSSPGRTGPASTS